MKDENKYDLFVDFGSTFTKLLLIDLNIEEIIGRSQSPSTVDTDIMVGLNAGLRHLNGLMGKELTYRHKLACSSAAGGLRMVAIGLVPDLTSEAAKRAALGAGAKVVAVYSYRLTRKELQEVEVVAPDIILLAGGTDGGDQKTIIKNATVLSRSNLNVPIVVAGNKTASDEIASILASENKEYVITDNVMPEIGVVKVEKVRHIIRKIFINKIVESKGMKKAEKFIDAILMPTPTAVLTAAKLLSQGTDDEQGFGDLVVVDIGGATTDIHSIGWGEPAETGIIKKGLPEPFVKRTVEGDLGMRYNASTILQAVGEKDFNAQLGKFDCDLKEAVLSLSVCPDLLPGTESEWRLDAVLARSAIRLAMERHVGHIETTYGPHGEVFIQYGKDLTGINTVIGSGGPLIFSSNPKKILDETKYSDLDAFSLKPKNPNYYLDETYLLYAIGLLSEVEPDRALRIAKKYLKRL